MFLRRDFRLWADYYAHSSLEKTQQLFNTASALGSGKLDHSAMVHALEAMAAHKVAPDA